MQDALSPFLMSGIVFGLCAGISPGPLLTLVITETLRHSVKEGVKVALAPLLTDVPIVLVSLFLLREAARSQTVLGVISLAGGMYLMYLGYECVTTKDVQLENNVERPSSLKKGAITNFLNPHPYLFWITVGAPTVLKGTAVGLLAPIFFITGFYVFIVGSKVGVACIVGRFRSFLQSAAYVWTMRILGIALWFFALVFIRDGLGFFGVVIGMKTLGH